MDPNPIKTIYDSLDLADSAIRERVEGALKQGLQHGGVQFVAGAGKVGKSTTIAHAFSAAGGDEEAPLISPDSVNHVAEDGRNLLIAQVQDEITYLSANGLPPVIRFEECSPTFDMPFIAALVDELAPAYPDVAFVTDIRMSDNTGLMDFREQREAFYQTRLGQFILEHDDPNLAVHLIPRDPEKILGAIEQNCGYAYNNAADATEGRANVIELSERLGLSGEAAEHVYGKLERDEALSVSDLYGSGGRPR